MPKKIPVEIQVLVDSHQRDVPVVVIMTRNCSLLPVPLPTQYAYSYLGFFHLTELNVGTIQIFSLILIFSLPS